MARKAPLVHPDWTNADAVKDFLDAHPQGVRYGEDDMFVLPDIEQSYTVTDVRFFRMKGGPRLYLDLIATCAVEGCGEEFIVTRSVQEMRHSPQLTRCCEMHRGQWRTPMPNAWRTQEELAILRDVERTRAADRAEKAAPRPFKRWESAVLEAAADYALLTNAIDVMRLAQRAADKEPARKVGGRDTRLQQARRAMAGLIAKGVLRKVGPAHVDLTVLPA